MAPDFFMGPGEKPLREEDYVYYHGGMSRFGSPMRGKLILTDKRFAYIEMETVKIGGILGFGQTPERRSKGIKINLPAGKVIGASTETRTRKKGTLNQPGTLMSKEQYRVLTVSMETEMGVENPSFEVMDPDGWATVIMSQGSESL